MNDERERVGHVGERGVGEHLHRSGDVGVHGHDPFCHHHRPVLRGDPGQRGQDLERSRQIEQCQSRIQHEGDGLLTVSFSGHRRHRSARCLRMADAGRTR
jgi:hypothetical protein